MVQGFLKYIFILLIKSLHFSSKSKVQASSKQSIDFFSLVTQSYFCFSLHSSVSVENWHFKYYNVEIWKSDAASFLGFVVAACCGL